ncbi:MAG: hypothetical protein Q4E53_00740 [Eubacteriales bacterium]|nr:hypothetical protein [Eubacteriales bacterium]
MEQLEYKSAQYFPQPDCFQISLDFFFKDSLNYGLHNEWNHSMMKGKKINIFAFYKIGGLKVFIIRTKILISLQM